MSIKVKSKLTGMSKVGCLLYGALIVFGLYCYIHNFVKLCQCDFASPYKMEVIHAIGIVMPPTSVITVWFPVQ
jgi:hypothetical protein